ncbi:MAG: SDR family NAD(P)-dependent oxidoreductase [Pseudomonadota bacterium]|jgi:NAD(P)-dependent dehydrogenase (short-subunit alcohol dehydrogenase family)
MNRVDGKVALVTGGARGIGGMSAQKLAEAGAKVVITDLREDEAQATLAAIKSAGGEAKFFKHDVADEDQWAAAVKFAVESYGGVDILLNNAGIAGAAKPLEELSLDSWRRLMSINLDGVFLGFKHVIPSMKARAHMWKGGGSIISISSIMGFIGGARSAAYCASKGGVRLLTKAAALELAPAKIRVNSVHPGFINTPLLRAGQAAMDQRQEGGFQRWVDGIVSRHPLGRLGEEQDIAHAVRFLASDDAAFMTGTEVVVDGGYLAQ